MAPRNESAQFHVLLKVTRQYWTNYLWNVYIVISYLTQKFIAGILIKIQRINKNY